MALTATTCDGFVGTITLDHPQKRNALSAALVQEVVEALASLKARQARVAILRAPPGTRVWSAGHDVDELPAGRRDPLGWDDPLRHLIREIEQFPAPVIAMVEGSVWGGACETVFACDLIVAAEGATFAATPAKLGVPYNISGMLTFLNAADPRIVKEMVFTAKPISAERAERLGMINHLVPAHELEPFTLDLALTIAANAPLSIAVMKEQLRIPTGLVREFVAAEQAKLDLLVSGGGTEDASALRVAMQEIMTAKVGIFRTGADLAAAVSELQALLERSRHIGLRHKAAGANPELATAYRVQKMLKLALCVAHGAAQRTESRGAHFREDFPRRDDAQWLKRTLATWQRDADLLPTLAYEPIDVQGGREVACRRI